MASTGFKANARLGRPSLPNVDQYIGRRMRERRILLGISMHQIAGLIGVTNQQAHKYEHGINRITAGRLFVIAQALGVDVDYFVAGMDIQPSLEPTLQQRELFELIRNFVSLPRKHQEAISSLARALADPKLAQIDDCNDGSPRDTGAS